MGEEFKYYIDLVNTASTLTDYSDTNKMRVTSPVKLQLPDLQMLLFEKFVQKNLDYRTRDFTTYRKRELAKRGEGLEGIFRGLDDVVLAFCPGEPHKQLPQYFGKIATARRPLARPFGPPIEEEIWTVRCVPGLIEGLLPGFPYLEYFENLAADEKQEHISLIFLSGGPDRCGQPLQERCEQECAILKAKGSEANFPQAFIDQKLDATRKRYEFIAKLAQVFTANELKEMDDYLGHKVDPHVRCLAKMVQHTSTLYIPDPVKSYGIALADDD